MHIQNKQYLGPQTDARRKWNEALAFIKSINGSTRTGASTVSPWKPTDVVLEIESPKQQRIHREIRARAALRSLEAKRDWLHEMRADATPNVLGRTHYVNDPTIPWTERFIPVDFRR